MPNHFDLITDAPEERAYPISSFTWLLVPAEFSDKSKLKAMKDFLQWILMSTDGQKLTEQLQYATLPSQIVGPMVLMAHKHQVMRHMLPVKKQRSHV